MLLSAPYPSPATVNLRHLHPSIWSLTDASQEERIASLYRPQWIPYPAGDEILARIDFIMHYPRCSRMPCLLVHGSSNTGKTMIIDKFERDHPHLRDPYGEIETRKILRVQMPAKPDDIRFYYQIVRGYGTQAPPLTKSLPIDLQALQVLQQHPPEIVVIDELQHLLAGTPREQQHFLTHLRFLSSELELPIVAFGTSNALRGVNLNEKIAARFEILAMPRWRPCPRLTEFVVRFGRQLPLELASDFEDPAICNALCELSNGLTGGITSLLAQSAEMAIRDGTEQITLSLINDAADGGLYRLHAELARDETDWE